MKRSCSENIAREIDAIDTIRKPHSARNFHRCANDHWPLAVSSLPWKRKKSRRRVTKNRKRLERSQNRLERSSVPAATSQVRSDERKEVARGRERTFFSHDPREFACEPPWTDHRDIDSQVASRGESLTIRFITGGHLLAEISIDAAAEPAMMEARPGTRFLRDLH